MVAQEPPASPVGDVPWGYHYYHFYVSCVLNVLHGGTKQGKAYAAAYALLTHCLRAHKFYLRKL